MGKRGRTGEHLNGRYGKSSNGWKGGVTYENGYRLLFKPEHPNSDSKGYVREHRYIMSEKIGRPLKKGEVVHHINDDRLDNRIENLELHTASTHCLHHLPVKHRPNFKCLTPKGEICDGCGKKFKPNRNRRHTRAFCSRECWVENH